MFRSEKYDEPFLRFFSAFWLEYESSLVHVSLDTERGRCRLSQLFDPNLYTHSHAHTRACGRIVINHRNDAAARWIVNALTL